jgi:NOL1/NOP2/sun family putative RNA methylase
MLIRKEYEMLNKIPEFLYDMLLEQYGDETLREIIKGYSTNKNVTFRVNTLKSDVQTVKKVLIDNKIEWHNVEWYQDAFVIENADEERIKKLEIYINGEIYLQSLSSMFPVTILNPKPYENILDMAAAPGGKTTQIAAVTNNNALISACEKNKIRAERLKYNIQKQGISCVNIMLQDARNLDEYFSFDKILLDAPCSGSGTLNLLNQGLDKKINQDLVNRSAKTQYELLRKAVQILKSGHEMVYSTCSILKIENEDNIQKILKSENVELVPIEDEMLVGIPRLPTKIKGTVCIMPTKLYEGFFVAKIKKL